MDDMFRRPKRPKISLDPVEPTVVKPDTEPAPTNPSLEESNQPISDPGTMQETPEEHIQPEPNQPTPPKKQSLLDKIKNFKVPTPKTKKQWIIAGAAIAILLGGAATAVYWFIIRDTSEPVVNKIEPPKEPEPEPEPIISRLSGRELTNAEINNRPIYAVQIENSPEARPQSGLMEADIIFEAIAEGGITRFNAIFQDNIPANIGPVRSLRPYFIDWFMPFDASLIHAGGSGEALSDVRALGIRSIDSERDIMRRISSRYSPHNYYTRGQQVLDFITARNHTSSFTSLPRKEAAPSEAPNAKNITLDISSTLYRVNYAYDAASNTYLRSQGGNAHIDAESKKQLAPSVIVVPIMTRSTHPDRVHTHYGTTGSGKVYVFQDGTVTEGTWTKSARNSQWKLTDAEGKDIELNPGQTWFSMVESTSRVSFQP